MKGEMAQQNSGATSTRMSLGTIYEYITEWFSVDRLNYWRWTYAFRHSCILEKCFISTIFNRYAQLSGLFRIALMNVIKNDKIFIEINNKRWFINFWHLCASDWPAHLNACSWNGACDPIRMFSIQLYMHYCRPISLSIGCMLAVITSRVMCLILFAK